MRIRAPQDAHPPHNSASREAPAPPAGVVGVWCATRAGELELGLPLTPRSLWLARVLAVLTNLAAAVLPPAAIFGLWSWSRFDLSMLGLGGHLASGLAFTFFCLQAWRPRLHRVPWSWPVAGTVGLGLAVTGLALWLRSASVSFAALAVGLGLAVWTYRRLPVAFSLAEAALPVQGSGSPSFASSASSAAASSAAPSPVAASSAAASSEAASSTAPSPEAPSPEAPSPEAARRRVLLRHCVLHPVPLGLLVLTVVYAGLTALDRTSLSAGPLFFAAWLATWGSRFGWNVLRKLGHLPISRARVLAYASLPGLVVLLTGVVGARLLLPAPDGPAVTIDTDFVHSLAPGESLRLADAPPVSWSADDFRATTFHPAPE